MRDYIVIASPPPITPSSQAFVSHIADYQESELFSTAENHIQTESDWIKALVNFSVAFNLRNPMRKPIESIRALFGEDYYICRFQEPGEAEAEFGRTRTSRTRSTKDYGKAIKEEISKVVKLQEELDIDVLVRGEHERIEMVEYFGEQLSGFAFTTNGWVQSYGSRCVKPPIIYGDVSMPKAMTVLVTPQFA